MPQWLATIPGVPAPLMGRLCTLVAPQDANLPEWGTICFACANRDSASFAQAMLGVSARVFLIGAHGSCRSLRKSVAERTRAQDRRLSCRFSGEGAGHASPGISSHRHFLSE